MNPKVHQMNTTEWCNVLIVIKAMQMGALQDIALSQRICSTRKTCNKKLTWALFPFIASFLQDKKIFLFISIKLFDIKTFIWFHFCLSHCVQFNALLVSVNTLSCSKLCWEFSQAHYKDHFFLSVLFKSVTAPCFIFFSSWLLSYFSPFVSQSDSLPPIFCLLFLHLPFSSYPWRRLQEKNQPQRKLNNCHIAGKTNVTSG